MRPTFSIMFFTVMSGCGYGMLFLCGIGLLAAIPVAHDTIAAGLLGGFLLSSAGLSSSLLHLGQPQRAWRALSQWRTSWLSREGVAALITLVPLFALISVFLPPHFLSADHAPIVALAAALAAMSAITVYCTSGIYSSLKTIHAWHNAYVLPGYLSMALLGGASGLWMIEAVLHIGDGGTQAMLPILVCVLGLICAAIKIAYWRFIDTTRHAATKESATGLGRFGTVRSLEAPHTEENYLTHEMGFAIARKHGSRLRTICIGLMSVLPILLATIGLLVPSAGLAAILACAGTISIVTGLFVERWLFVAQAKHVVMLYY
jgi:sulfite dehydrogenase (quinone) subunit SoeC